MEAFDKTALWNDHGIVADILVRLFDLYNPYLY
jgi:hypothetical protein